MRKSYPFTIIQNSLLYRLYWKYEYSMSILFSKTEKGKPVLIENDFDYIEERTHENKVCWRCTQCNKQKCKARLYTTGNTI